MSKYESVDIVVHQNDDMSSSPTLVQIATLGVLGYVAYRAGQKTTEVFGADASPSDIERAVVENPAIVPTISPIGLDSGHQGALYRDILPATSDTLRNVDSACTSLGSDTRADAKRRACKRPPGSGYDLRDKTPSASTATPNVGNWTVVAPSRRLPSRGGVALPTDKESCEATTTANTPILPIHSVLSFRAGRDNSQPPNVQIRH